VSVSSATAAELLALGVFAGWLGAVVGIGGGVIIVPALFLGFGFDIRACVAASLVAVVATSTAAGSAYVGEGLANMRLGMTLEIATTIGGIAGGLLATVAPTAVLSGLFAVMMLVTASAVLRGRTEDGAAGAPEEAEPLGDRAGDAEGFEVPGELAGAYVDQHRGVLVHYRVRRLEVGSAVSLVAGAVSGLLGVGGGFLKVPAMNLGMGVPIRVAAATSNFMIGVTAIASLFVYFARGDVHPLIAAPVALGIVAGATMGARQSARVGTRMLARILGAVLIFVALQMALKAAGVNLGR